MREEFFYYAYTSRDGSTYLMREVMNPYLMVGDYLLFDSAEECIDYWKKQGVEVKRHV